jgi:hypothetical protein
VELAGHGHKVRLAVLLSVRCLNSSARLMQTCAHLPISQVDVFTAFHDPARCFKETVGGPFSVTVAGGWFPRHLLRRAHALCAYIRCTLVALYIAWLSWRRQAQYDVIIVDQVLVGSRPGAGLVLGMVGWRSFTTATLPCILIF